MKATVESTQVTLKLDGVPVRLWKGVTDGGMPFTLFVHRAMPDARDDTRAFDAEFIEVAPARAIEPGEVPTCQT